jgi:hypothetical protein
MSWELFERILAMAGRDLIRLDLFNYGDPFVHPQAVEMVEYIKKKFPHIYLYTSTNGLMLSSEAIKRLVYSGLDEITFSVDGINQASYEKYRKGGDFQKVIDIMSEFVFQRDLLKREVPFINWRYILFKWNDSIISRRKAKRIAAKIGVDRLTWEITDHPVEAKSKKFQVGTPGWEKIYHEIWDSSQVGNAINHKQFKAKIDVPVTTWSGSVNVPLTVDVVVKNIGGALWRAHSYSGRRIIRLGAQLFDGGKNLVNLNYARASINSNIEDSKKHKLQITLPPIGEPGEYWLKFDMVNEGIDWFESGGSSVIWKKYTIENS